MSKYMEDIQGKIVSNPINETNTKYPYIEKENNIRPGDKYSIDTQYMYNDNEPVSDIDTTYYADYRNKIEELRKRTESTYEALESCLVPVEIPGMSFQPFEYVQTELDSGEVVEERVKSFTYFFKIIYLLSVFNLILEKVLFKNLFLEQIKLSLLMTDIDALFMIELFIL